MLELAEERELALNLLDFLGSSRQAVEELQGNILLEVSVLYEEKYRVDKIKNCGSNEKPFVHPVISWKGALVIEVVMMEGIA